MPQAPETPDRQKISDMSIKRLAKDTAIYGLSSILGRALYFLLTPLYTRLFSEAEYGIVSGVFAFSALMMVVFTYRMETAYFRYESDPGEKKQPYFDTAMLSIIGSTVLLTALLLGLAPGLAAALKYPDQLLLIRMAIVILALDALSEIPLSRLRLDGRPIRFAVVRLTGIFTNIGLNLFFLVFCPYVMDHLSGWQWIAPFIESIYDPAFGIGYIFLANLLASLVVLLLLLPYILRIRLQFDWEQWRRMVRYAAPLIIVGFSYVINEVLDRNLMPLLLTGTLEENRAQLGIYGANYKLATLIALFIQAYRYGAEPFFFKQKHAVNARQLYADLAGFFAGIGGLAFLGITLFLDFTRYFIDEPFWAGLKVVPILAMANIFLGLYYNFAAWYKLADLTRWGAYISAGGAVITIVLNLWWIPLYGYVGSAWATLLCYGSMAVATWWFGRRFYPIPYPVHRIALYLVAALVIWAAGQINNALLPGQLWWRTLINGVLFGGYLLLVVRMERPQIRQYFGR